MRSMTGYGKGTASSDGRTMTVEIKTVNHKFFDWGMKMPKGFLFAEDDAKKAVAKVVARGHADVFLTYREEAGKAAEYRVDAELASKYVATASGLASLTGVPCDVTATGELRSFADSDEISGWAEAILARFCQNFAE